MKRILVVEHNELGRDVLVRRLIATGFEVLVASNGDEGCAWRKQRARI